MPSESRYQYVVARALNRLEPRPSIREVARRIGFSHEKVRRTVAGGAPVSRDFNHALATVLQTDEQELWAAAVADEVRRAKPSFDSDDDRPPILELWDRLNESDRGVLLRV